MAANDVNCSDKKIKFRSISTTADPHYSLNRVEDIYLPRPRSKFDQKSKLLKDPEKDRDSCPSLWQFLHSEITRGYVLEHGEEEYDARREKVYSFMKIPREVEKFFLFGFLQCADSFLFVYTFLPIRFSLAVCGLLTRPFKRCFRSSDSILKPAEICDLLKGCILIICFFLMSYVDTSIMYHLIKSQSVIKLYIFYNMLEVGDRLFSAFGQDVLDSLLWTSTGHRSHSSQHLGTLPHLLFGVAYVFLHAFLVLCQATTLNVAINSSNKALLTIMMSNNFVELKGSVFKKFDKHNLYQVACSDVRERFHLTVLLVIVVIQTLKEYAWKEETLLVMLPDCLLVLGAEVLVDWIKHAFITRFNELPCGVYRDYTLSLAYDMAQTRHENAWSDHSDLVARRMGFIPLPLGVVMVKIFQSSIHVQGMASWIIALLAYLTLNSLRILNYIIILFVGCSLIDHHERERTTSESSNPGIKDSATSPTHPGPGRRRDSTEDMLACPLSPNTSLGPNAIFSNSTVSMNDVCLNEEMLKVGVDQIEDEEEEEEDEDNMSRSAPDIQGSGGSPSLGSDLPSLRSELVKSESEPNIAGLPDNRPV